MGRGSEPRSTRGLGSSPPCVASLSAVHTGPDPGPRSLLHSLLRLPPVSVHLVAKQGPREMPAEEQRPQSSQDSGSLRVHSAGQGGPSKSAWSSSPRWSGSREDSQMEREQTLGIHWLGSDLSPVTLGTWLDLSLGLNFFICKRKKAIRHPS